MDRTRPFRSDERGASELVGYLLSLFIITFLMAGLIVPASTYFDGQESIATSNELETQGQQLSSTVHSVDRLVRQSNSSGEIGQTIALPETAQGNSYTVEVINESVASNPDSACDRQCLRLEAGDVTQVVFFRSLTTVEATSFVGGPVYVVRPDGESTIRFNTSATG
jgi:hypothetical protein